MNAGRYPLRKVWDEVKIATSRVNHLLASQALLTQMVVGSVMSKESGDTLKKAIKELTSG